MRFVLTLVAFVSLWFSPAHAYRIAIDADGNYNDKDDWAATPLTLAILAKAGRQGQVVHYSFNNSIGLNTPSMQRAMTDATLQAARDFNFNLGRFYNVQGRLSEAVTNLRNQINMSTSGNRLVILAAGPMELIWRAVKAAQVDKRQHVTVVSHSPWNNKQLGGGMSHNAADVKRLGVRWVQITDQNRHLFTDRWRPWHWLRDAAQLRMRRIYGWMVRTGKPDVSDAGLAYWLVRRDPRGTPAKLNAYFGVWS